MTQDEQKVLYDWLLENPDGFTFLDKNFIPMERWYSDRQYEGMLAALSRGNFRHKKTVFPRILAFWMDPNVPYIQFSDHNVPYIQFDEGAPV